MHQCTSINHVIINPYWFNKDLLRRATNLFCMGKDPHDTSVRDIFHCNNSLHNYLWLSKVLSSIKRTPLYTLEFDEVLGSLWISGMLYLFDHAGIALIICWFRVIFGVLWCVLCTVLIGALYWVLGFDRIQGQQRAISPFNFKANIPKK